jgi:catechol-2,3-dioxygenase
MNTSGFSHYNLRAPRAMLEQLRDFYCEVVGLVQGPRPEFRTPGFWLYAGGEPVLHLSETAPGESRPAGVVSTFDHAAFRCSGRAEFERNLARRGIEYRTDRPRSINLVQLFLHDPAGNGVELNFAELADLAEPADLAP